MRGSKEQGFIDRLNKALDKNIDIPRERGRIAALAKALDVKHQSATKWFNGDNMPDRDKLKKICELTDVSLDWLVNGTPIDEVGTPQIAYPFISWDNFEIEYAQFKKSKKTENTLFFDEGARGEIKDAFAVQVPLNEPCPRFLENMEALIDPNSKPENGGLALVYFNNTKSLALQEVKIVGAQVMLVALETVPGVNNAIDINDSRVKYLGMIVKKKKDNA